MQDEKARQRRAEEERRADEARRGKVDASSAAIVRRLQRKRFAQVGCVVPPDWLLHPVMCKALQCHCSKTAALCGRQACWHQE